MSPIEHIMATELCSIDIKFGNVTLHCLCRRPGEVPQKCWTLQSNFTSGDHCARACQESWRQYSHLEEIMTQDPTDSGDLRFAGAAVPEQTVDDIGLDIWPASEVLCRFLANHPALATHATSVLELGAGVGLPGLLAALLGEALVMLTDYDPQVLEVLQQNVDSNKLSGRGRVHQIDWRTWRGEPDLGRYGLVLGADLLYASALVKDFVEVLKHVLAPDGVFLMAHQIRRSILLDPKTRVPRLEKFDAPFERFQLTIAEIGMHMRKLFVFKADETDSMGASEFCVLAVGWTEATLNNMPLEKLGT